MAKKKPLYGVNNYHKRTPKKRPGKHAKKLLVNAYPNVRSIVARGVSLESF